jgi:hypothetical protein
MVTGPDAKQRPHLVAIARLLPLLRWRRWRTFIHTLNLVDLALFVQ